MGGNLSLLWRKTQEEKEPPAEDVEYDITEDRVLGTIYGNCIGDAIGLLTEFMVKEEAKKYYGKKVKTGLQYTDKVPDMHRSRWQNGDWTDDSDQMILILQMLLEKNGQVDDADFARRLTFWRDNGNPEHGDLRGMGIGQTTVTVQRHPEFLTNPHKAAEAAWEGTGRYVAPNGALMRTSILGTYQFADLDKVISNTLNICKTTHFDHRCQASCVAVTTAIALMLQRNPAHLAEKGDGYNIDAIIDAAYSHAVKCLPEGNADMVEELHQYIYVKSQKLSLLQLDEHGKIGYTYKCLGSGFWALRQNNFKQALTALLMEAGDADTNGAVAGALLGCKLGAHSLPNDWLQGLLHKAWLDDLIKRYFELGTMGTEQGESAQNMDDKKSTEGQNRTVQNVKVEADVTQHQTADTTDTSADMAKATAEPSLGTADTIEKTTDTIAMTAEMREATAEPSPGTGDIVEKTADTTDTTAELPTSKIERNVTDGEGNN